MTKYTTAHLYYHFQHTHTHAHTHTRTHLLTQQCTQPHTQVWLKWLLVLMPVAFSQVDQVYFCSPECNRSWTWVPEIWGDCLQCQVEGQQRVLIQWIVSSCLKCLGFHLLWSCDWMLVKKIIKKSLFFFFYYHSAWGYFILFSITSFRYLLISFFTNKQTKCWKPV